MKGLIAGGMLMAVAVAVAVAADAQTFAVEAGGSGVGVTEHAFGLGADTAVGGGYLGGSLEMPFDMFSVYVTGDWWSTTGVAGRFGGSARLVPAGWLVRVPLPPRS